MTENVWNVKTPNVCSIGYIFHIPLPLHFFNSIIVMCLLKCITIYTNGLIGRIAVSKTAGLGSSPSSCVGWFGSIHPESNNKTTSQQRCW